MKNHLFELLWDVETDSVGFLYREFRGFGSEDQARKYGKGRERYLNDGVSPEERAHDGYSFKFYGAWKVEEIDGYGIELFRLRAG